MKIHALLSALLFSTAAWANPALESELLKLDQKLAERTFEELVAGCEQKVTFSQMDPETRESSQFKATHKKCDSDQISLLVKRTSGSVGSRKVEVAYTRDTFLRNNGNPLRELLQDLMSKPYRGQLLTLDAFSVHEVKEGKTSLRTRDGYEDFSTINVWLMVQTQWGEQQLHVTFSNDARLSYGARLLEVFFEMTPLLTVTAAE